MTVAVLGASGPLGRRVSELLVERSDSSGLLLLSRSPEGLADLGARGAVVRRGKLKDPTGLKRDLRGVDTLLLLASGDPERRAELHAGAIAAAIRAGVRQLVYPSIVAPSADNPAFLVPDHAATEGAIRESGLDWTILRSAPHVEGLASVARAAAETGRLPWNGGDGGIAWVARDDLAEALVSVLLTDGHEREVYGVTGPQAMGGDALAAAVAQAFGRPVEAEPVSDDVCFDRLYDADVPQAEADRYAAFGEAARAGFFAKVSRDGPDLTGRPATPLATVLDRAAGSPS